MKQALPLLMLSLFAGMTACGTQHPADTPATPASAAAGLAVMQEFRARGNEPFWAIDVEDDTLHYVTPEMDDGKTLQARREDRDGVVSFSGSDGALPFTLEIRAEACEDSMSGKRFDFSATWRYGDERMTGCAAGS
ncbi:COG3650 family protein [Luteimonas mephitis]|uniref:COG3650 family protein n=1 Tax=Luteimonas mephitis TaxID=83615 RepID=UPI0004179450|nr:hypothetical protein [Luteimonas mephitis]